MFSLNHPLPQIFLDRAKEVESEEMKALFKNVNYKIVLNFDREIKKISTEAKTTNNKQQVIIESNLEELRQDPNKMNIELKLK